MDIKLKQSNLKLATILKDKHKNNKLQIAPMAEKGPKNITVKFAFSVLGQFFQVNSCCFEVTSINRKLRIGG